ncbi:serine hydrolase domain-containing protein [Nonomuraea sp. NPDC050783]|uniref:serine hydrolase domain-containing protein n=1 Tax=Nonomuraea sp. NPDC050783 TaxID=3154634 RepID=UPI003465A0F3
MDQFVTEGGIPGALAEIREGEERWVGTAGVADRESGRERCQEDRFRVGSVTKAFTATVVLKLVAEGRLSLGDPVERWLPGVVGGNGHDGREITVRQLLNQTSGIFNYTLDPRLLSAYVGPGFLEHRFDHFSPGDLVAVAMRNAPAFAPGTSWGYSNTNFVLAAMIAERITGNSFAAELDRLVIEPLGLGGTYLPGEETGLRGPHGRQYSTLMLAEPGAPVHDVTELNASSAWAAGGLVSTAGDLHRFYRALLGGRLLPPALEEEMFTGVPTEGGQWIPGTTYGLGVFWQRLPGGTTVWGGGGAIHGSWTYAMGSRDGSRFAVANINGDWGDLLPAFARLLDAAFG